MNAPAGYAFRHPRPDEAAAVAELMTIADADSEEEFTADDIAREWRSLDLDRDVWVVDAPEGGLAAAVATWSRQGAVVASDGYVHPSHTGRGLGGSLLELTEKHARELVGGPATVQSGTLASNGAALALFEHRGYAPVRHFFRMVIDLEREPPAPQWPPGLEPRAFDLRDAAAFHAAVEEAFADEFGHIPETFEAWRARRVEAPEATLDLWLTVWDGDEVAATLMCDRERFGMGWIGSVGVREPWRRRGLGRALLDHAFGEFWRIGQHRVALGVDAENPTGATRLYERAGMHVLFDYILFEKAVP